MNYLIHNGTMNLKNKIVAITGSSRGLGAALAADFTSQGAKIIINARNKKATAAAAKKMGVDFYSADVKNETQMNKMADYIFKKYGRIDIWINNAGISIPHSPIEKINLRLARGMIDVNLFGVINGSLSVLKMMRKQKFGIIMNILSTSALEGRPHSAAYCASKWASRGFAESLRFAVKEDNVLVFNVYPGGMKTNFFGSRRPADYNNRMTPEYVADKIIKNLKKTRPLSDIIIKTRNKIILSPPNNIHIC